jgi:hypothetical protein
MVTLRLKVSYPPLLIAYVLTSQKGKTHPSATTAHHPRHGNDLFPFAQVSFVPHVSFPSKRVQRECPRSIIGCLPAGHIAMRGTSSFAFPCAPLPPLALCPTEESSEPRPLWWSSVFLVKHSGSFWRHDDRSPCRLADEVREFPSRQGLENPPGITSVFEHCGGKGDTLSSLVVNPETVCSPLCILFIWSVKELDVPIAEFLFQIQSGECNSQFEGSARSAHPAISFFPSDTFWKKSVTKYHAIPVTASPNGTDTRNPRYLPPSVLTRE